MRVTVLLPSLNEAEGIQATIRRIPLDELRREGWDAGVVVVDGASTDGTGEAAARLGAIVVVEPRPGYGRAYKTGFARAPGDYIVTADADDTYPLDGLVEILRTVRTRGLDFATLDRFAGLRSGAMSFTHRFGNRVLTLAVWALWGIRLHDSQSGMWVLSRRALDRMPFGALSDGMAFSQELKLLAFRDPDLKCVELPGAYRARVGDVKLSRWSDGPRNLFEVIRRRLHPPRTPGRP